MAREHIGHVCAYIKDPNQEKASYPKIGDAFQDEQGRISIKLDSIPIPGAWKGWLNVFPVREQFATKQSKPADTSNNFDDDIPF